MSKIEKSINRIESFFYLYYIYFLCLEIVRSNYYEDHLHDFEEGVDKRLDHLRDAYDLDIPNEAQEPVTIPGHKDSVKSDLESKAVLKKIEAQIQQLVTHTQQPAYQILVCKYHIIQYWSTPVSQVD